MRKLKYTSLGLLAALSTLLLSGCLFGSGSENIPVAYTGKTSPAEINKDNGDEIAANGFSGQSMGGAVQGIAAADVDAAGEPRKLPSTPVIASIFKGLADNLQAIENMDVPTVVVSGAATTVSGSCGGSATTDVGNGSISASYDDYCDFGVTMSGRATFSGDFNNGGTFTISQLRVRGAGFDLSMNGTMTFSGSIFADSFSFTTNMVYRDNISGESFKAENYRISYSAGGMSISGRMYMSQYGYVDIETLQPFDFNLDYPNGKIRLSGQNSSVTLEFLSNGKIRITVANGSTIVSSEDIDWNAIFEDL